MTDHVLNVTPEEIPGVARDYWKEAVIDQLIINWAFKKIHETDPRTAVHDLICTEVAIALDPLVSDEAVQLISQGMEVQDKRLRYVYSTLTPTNSPESYEEWLAKIDHRLADQMLVQATDPQGKLPL